MASETECVAQCSTNLTLLRLVEGVVEIVIDLRILVVFLVVNGWRNDVVLQAPMQEPLLRRQHREGVQSSTW